MVRPNSLVVRQTEASLTDAALPHHATRRGILYMALAILGFTAMDAVAKGLVAHYPVTEVIWARFVGHLGFVLIYLRRRVVPALKTKLPLLHLARSLTQLGATAFFFISLKYIGLAEATALADINPVLITLGAGLFLGERLGPARLIGVGIATVGALIVTRPGLAVFTPAAVLPVICAVCFAANMLLTRLAGIRESPWVSMVYGALLGTLFTSVPLPLVWQPINLVDLPAFALLGLLGAVAQLLIIRAFSLAQASAVAPFGYLDIVFATFWSITAFQEYPDRFTLIGALVIALAGLYVWRQEYAAGRPT